MKVQRYFQRFGAAISSESELHVAKQGFSRVGWAVQELKDILSLRF
jgi:hypothetical protein